MIEKPEAIQVGMRELLRPLARRDVPDAIFPTDNEYGIPLLDMTMQAEFLVLPWTRWGEISRRAQMSGTYHFYTDDYKFEALWKDPTPVVNSQCINVVEPNFSTNAQMPMAVILWQIYRRRWLARYWQHYGVHIFVNLCVAPRYADLNLRGVPMGWNAYATRGLSKQLDLVVADHDLACEHSGNRAPLFAVYGGGKAVEELCLARGWTWLPENMHVKDRRREHG